MYKKIALKTHPDRVQSLRDAEKKEKLKIFNSLGKALEVDDIGLLVEIAEKLEIEHP